MRIIMKKNNVERYADNAAAKSHLEALGYKAVAPVQQPYVSEGEGNAQVAYEKLKIDELKEIAVERGIEGAESMKKAELVELLNALDG